jgi:adenylyltransferase/sulfurtransferase
MIHGSIYKYEGIVSVFNYLGGPTYRCYNPEFKTGDFRNPAPAEVGLFGVLPGIAGIFMANETIKIITGSGSILSGKVLHFNLFSNTFRTIAIKNIPGNHEITEISRFTTNKQTREKGI